MATIEKVKGKNAKVEKIKINKPLTHKEELFCQYYVKTANASKSATLAGYSEKNAGPIGFANLKKEHIQKRIEEINDKLKSDLIADQTEIKKLLTEIARGNFEEEVVVVENDTISGKSRAKKFKKKVSGKDRLKALELLGKINLMFKDTNINGQNTNKVVIISGEDEILE